MSLLEDVKEILEEVQRYLQESQDSRPAQASLRESIQNKIQSLCQNHPQLQLMPPSPAPYVPMKSAPGIMGRMVETSQLDNVKSMTDDNLNDCSGLIPPEKLIKSEKWGYLEKKGKERLAGLLSPFQRRWCAVKDGMLFYFEKFTDQHQKGQIDLRGYEARPAPTAIRDLTRKNQCFELVCPGKKTYQFIAPTPYDMREWIAAIEHHSQLSIDNEIQYDDNLPSDNEGIYEFVENELMNDQDSNKPDDPFNPEEWYMGLWNCEPADGHELGFNRGDLIRIVSKEFDLHQWWVGEKDGCVGLLPKNYLIEAYE